MEKTRKEIECLNRMQVLNSTYEDILEFLLGETVITRDEIKAFKQSADQAKLLQGILSSLSKSGKLQLLEYEWTILPVERIKILVVTDRNNKEFSYNF